MSANGQQSSDPTTTSTPLAALTKGAADRPESRVLDALVGDWQVRATWEPIPGGGVQDIEATTHTEWILGGRVLESRSTNPDGIETTRVLFAFDPIVGDYTAYSVTMLSTYFVLERGRHDPEARTLVFDACEPVPDGPAIAYRRNIHLLGDDRYDMFVSYPGVPEGTYGAMFIHHERIG